VSVFIANPIHRGWRIHAPSYPQRKGGKLKAVADPKQPSDDVASSNYENHNLWPVSLTLNEWSLPSRVRIR
jgi:hypothetical protein